MESESTPREYVVLPGKYFPFQLACGHLESVVHASYKYYLAWLLSHSNEIENANAAPRTLVYR